jgi:hypothetical protein
VANLTSVGFTNEIDLESLRARLRKMNDAELLRFGRAAKSMCSPDAYFGQPPRRFSFNLRKHGQNKSAEVQRRNIRDDKAGRPHQC